MPSINRFLSNLENLLTLTGASITASSVKASPNSVFVTEIDRDGTGSVSLAGSYTGHEDCTIDIEIISDTSIEQTISTAVFSGIGNGEISEISASGFDSQDVEVSLISLGVETTYASVPLSGVVLQAKNIGEDGNDIRISVDSSGITRTATGYSVFDDLAADTESVTGDEWNLGQDIIQDLNADGTVNTAAARLALGTDPQVIKMYRIPDSSTGDYTFYFTPKLKRAINQNSVIYIVTGTYTVTVTDGTTTEVYPGIVTLYDFLSAVLASSAILTVVGVVAQDYTPAGMATIDLPLRTEPFHLPVTFDGSGYVASLTAEELDIDLASDHPTEKVVITCVNNDLIGSELWQISGPVSGTRESLATTGVAFTDALINFTIPRKYPPADENRFRHVLTTYVTRSEEDGEYEPPICVDLLALGPAATEKAITLTWRSRHDAPPDCACEEVSYQGNLNDQDCLGEIAEGGDGAMDVLYKQYLAAIYAWKRERMEANVDLSIGDGDIGDADDTRLKTRYSALLKYDRVDIKAVNLLVDLFRKYLKSIYEHAANTATAWETGIDYEEGEPVIALTGDVGLYYVATRDHTSAVEPTWSGDINELTPDGDWVCAGTRPIYLFDALWDEMTTEFDAVDTGNEGSEWWRNLNLEAWDQTLDYPEFSQNNNHEYQLGTYYIIPTAEVTTAAGLVTNADMTIWSTPGAAAIDFSSETVPRDYKTQRLMIWDSSLTRFVIGYIGEDGKDTASYIVSSSNGSVRNWTQIVSGFNEDDANGYSYRIYGNTTPNLDFRFRCTAGGIATDKSFKDFAPSLLMGVIYDGMVIGIPGTDVKFVAEAIDPVTVDSQFINSDDIHAQVQIYVNRWKAALDEILVMADEEPPFDNSSTTDLASGLCWEDVPTEAGYWVVNEGEYLPVFNNRIYYSCKSDNDGQAYSTLEFRLVIKVACPEYLKDGDKVYLQISGITKAYLVGDKITIPVVFREPLQLTGGVTGDDIKIWSVTLSIDGQLDPFLQDQARSRLVHGPIGGGGDLAWAIGDLVTGSTSGATGEISRIVSVDDYIEVEGVSGIFLEGETIVADDGDTAILNTVYPVAPYHYISGGKELSFLLERGGIPFELGDKFAFTLEAGQFQWRQNSGAWTGPVNIISGNISLVDGLYAAFAAGPSPSFEIGDSYSFRVVQPNAPSHFVTPSYETWRWAIADVSPSIVFDFGLQKAIDFVSIAHSLEESAGNVVAVEGSNTSDFSTILWTSLLTWRPQCIVEYIHQTVSVRYVRIRFLAPSSDGAISWIYLGSGVSITVPASAFTTSREYTLRRGQGLLSQSQYLGRRNNANLEYERFLNMTDLNALLDMIDYVKENDDQPIIFIPNYHNPDQWAYYVTIDADNIEIRDRSHFQLPESDTDGYEHRFGMRIPLKGVVQI